MSQSNRDEPQAARETTHAIGDQSRPDDHLEEEEKILAGRPDVNMPALLTRDVKGG